MWLWIFVSISGIAIVKYWASKQTGKLNRRLDSARRDLMKAKKRHKDAQQQQESVKTQEELQVERIRHMKDLIQDIQIRLTQRETKEDRIASARKSAAETVSARSVLGG